MGFRLRYLHHDLELSEGQFVVGRSAGCQLSLDDPLVSRRHAMFVVSEDAVTVEDLGSRNGIIVNGQRAFARTHLAPGDRVVIGSQELTLERESGERADTPSVPLHRRTLPKMVVADPVPDRPWPSDPTPSDVDLDASMVRRADAFSLLGGVAEKALQLGRADEAERLLAGPLADVVEASRAGKRVPAWLVDTSARFAAKLATATAKGAWADYVIELYQVQVRPCPAMVVDELYNAFRKVSAIDLTRLRAYLALLHEKQATFGPAERFLLQRVEGLERLAAVR